MRSHIWRLITHTNCTLLLYKYAFNTIMKKRQEGKKKSVRVHSGNGIQGQSSMLRLKKTNFNKKTYVGIFCKRTVKDSSHYIFAT